ncbi:MAG: parB-like partition protein [Bacteroidetes bacterium]|jgi:ParB family chromosome partitioning protein|nr:parB-like partition protein [Bacteroidota bacterium]
MSKNKLALGRGLASLIPTHSGSYSRSSVPEGDEGGAGAEFVRIDLSKIERNPYQPRADFSPDALDELKQSIKEKGVIQPITVRRIPEGYQLITGERRVRAAREAGLATIPAYVIEIGSEEEMLELALIENLQREQLNPIEIAISYRRLMDECGLTQEEVSQTIGKDRSTVTNFLRLLKLPEEIQVAVRHGDISGGHARALVALDDRGRQMKIFRKVLAKGLSVRETEQLARNGSQKAPRQAAKARSGNTATLSSVEDRLRRLLGTRVHVRSLQGGKGEIVIEYYSDEDLDRLIEVLDSINDQ